MLHQIRSMITSGHWWLHQDHRCRDVPSRSSGNVKMSTAVVDSVSWCGIWSFNKLLPWLRLGSIALFPLYGVHHPTFVFLAFFESPKTPSFRCSWTSESSFGFVIAPFFFFWWLMTQLVEFVKGGLAASTVPLTCTAWTGAMKVV